MNQIVCQENTLHAPDSSAGRYLRGSAGPFSLRRSHYFKKSRASFLSEERQQALIHLVREGDSDAGRKMMAYNMHLVIDFAKRYADRGLAPLDLIRFGIQGLIRAIDEFEPSGGFSFAGFATWCICQNIEAAIMRRGNMTYLHASLAAG